MGQNSGELMQYLYIGNTDVSKKNVPIGKIKKQTKKQNKTAFVSFLPTAHSSSLFTWRVPQPWQSLVSMEGMRLSADGFL